MRIALLSLLVLFSASASAQVGGNSTYEFLNMVPSARQASMGGNQIAVKDNDLNLAIFNPALLTEEMDNHLSLSYINYVGDINYGYASYAKHFDSVGTFSANLLFLDYGTFSGRDETGLATGDFGASDYSLNFGYGRQLDSLFSVGATLKFIYSNYEIYNSFGVAVDLGATYHNEKRGITASALMKNTGVQVSTYTPDTREPLPFELQVGVTKKLKHAPLRLGLMIENLQKWDLTYESPLDQPDEIDPLTGETIDNGGAGFGEKLLRHFVVNTELLLSDNFFIGVGFNYRRHQELKLENKPGLVGSSIGFGLRIKRFQLSYARASLHRAGASNHFTITTRLGSFAPKKS